MLKRLNRRIRGNFHRAWIILLCAELALAIASVFSVVFFHSWEARPDKASSEAFVLLVNLLGGIGIGLALGLSSIFVFVLKNMKPEAWGVMLSAQLARWRARQIKGFDYEMTVVARQEMNNLADELEESATRMEDGEILFSLVPGRERVHHVTNI